jgi:hypothetical protein
MANKIKGFYSELPPWGKGAIAVGGVVIVGFIIYTTYSRVRRRSALKEANVISDKAKQEITALQSKGIRPSYTPSQYESYSISLAEAMNGCGTTEETVFSVFNGMKNKADVLSLINAFGVRSYRPCAASQPISYTRWLFDNDAFGGTLPTWLEYDLSASDKEKINEILSSKKIDFQF